MSGRAVAGFFITGTAISLSIYLWVCMGVFGLSFGQAMLLALFL